jgi:hypothetical protein
MLCEVTIQSNINESGVGALISLYVMPKNIPNQTHISANETVIKNGSPYCASMLTFGRTFSICA